MHEFDKRICTGEERMEWTRANNSEKFQFAPVECAHTRKGHEERTR